MWVHRDVISRSSLFIKAQLEKGSVVLLGNGGHGAFEEIFESELEPLQEYIHWLYTGVVTNGIEDSCLRLFWEWKASLWLRDPVYANAVMDALIMREYDNEVTIFSGFEDHLEKALQGSKLWHWAVDSIGAVASTANMGSLRAPLIYTEMECGDDFLMDVFMKVLSRIENPEDHQIPAMADREKYHLTKETIEDARKAWIEKS